MSFFHQLHDNDKSSIFFYEILDASDLREIDSFEDLHLLTHQLNYIGATLQLLFADNFDCVVYFSSFVLSFEDLTEATFANWIA